MEGECKSNYTKLQDFKNDKLAAGQGVRVNAKLVNMHLVARTGLAKNEHYHDGQEEMLYLHEAVKLSVLDKTRAQHTQDVHIFYDTLAGICLYSGQNIEAGTVDNFSQETFQKVAIEGCNEIEEEKQVRLIKLIINGINGEKFELKAYDREFPAPTVNCVNNLNEHVGQGKTMSCVQWSSIPKLLVGIDEMEIWPLPIPIQSLPPGWLQKHPKLQVWCSRISWLPLFMGSRLDSDTVTGEELDELMIACMKMCKAYKSANEPEESRIGLALKVNPMINQEHLQESEQTSKRFTSLSEPIPIKFRPRGSKGKGRGKCGVYVHGKGKNPRSANHKPKVSVGRAATRNFEHRFLCPDCVKTTHRSRTNRARKTQSSRNGSNPRPGRNCSSFEIGLSELWNKHLRESMHNSLGESESVNTGSITENEFERARREQCSRGPGPSGGLVIPALKLKLTSSCENECHKHWIIDTDDSQELSGF